MTATHASDGEFASWFKSQRSSGSSTDSCVEVSPSRSGALIAVRDTKDRDGGMLVFPAQVFRGFIDDVRAGGYDLPDLAG